MMKELYRVLILAFILVSFFIYPFVVYNQTATNGFDFRSFISRVLIDEVIILLISSVCGGLLALIPFKYNSYTKRFKFVILILYLLFVLCFMLTMSLMRSINYNEVEIPPHLDCDKIRNGDFEAEGLAITRRDSIQTEIDLQTKIKHVYSIIWVNDCEYELIGVSPNDKNFKVKIISIEKNYHTLYVSELDENRASLVKMKNKDGS